MNLETLFSEINQQSFEGVLDLPVLKWNRRLKTSAGRFFPGSRKWIGKYPPKIEIASYLLELEDSEHSIRDTLAHEMIHYWLWSRHRPYGHNSEFYEKMKKLGVSRYNPVPKKYPPNYRYSCMSCKEQFLRMRKIKRKAACLKCCNAYNQGKYDERFLIILEEEIKTKGRKKPSRSVRLAREEQGCR